MQSIRPQRRKYHFIYKTTCVITNRYYIGMHSTENLDDGYLGSGKRLRNSINKYGKENHKVEILEFHNTREDLSKREAEIVNEDLLKDLKCMNLTVGGFGSFYSCNTNEGIEYRRHTFPIWSKAGNDALKQKMENNPEFATELRAKWKKAAFLGRKVIDEKYPSGIFFGKTHSDETKQLMSQVHKERGTAVGERNSQFGTMWIYNLETFENRKIDKLDEIPNGWMKGRFCERKVLSRNSVICPICNIEFSPIVKPTAVKFCGSDDCRKLIKINAAKKYWDSKKSS